ncbi:MAG: CHC2 zinc finger domain-containing protein [bacterium]
MKIDIPSLKRKINLTRIIEEDLGPSKNNKWLCPFHKEKTPSFSVKGDLWKCFGCGESGDAIKYIMLKHRVGFKRACEILGGGCILGEPRKSVPKVRVKEEGEEGPPSLEWQNRARKIIDLTKQWLWSDIGKKAKTWLNDRGLRDETLIKWSIGYNPKDQQLCGLWVTRGITIPCINEDSIWYIKIRRPYQDQKYINIPGGNNKALFGAESLHKYPSCIVTEGEFDCMLLDQEAGDLLGVATFGGTSGRIAKRWLQYLLSLERIFICFDMDSAGDGAAEKFLADSKRIQRIIPPKGSDITDFYKTGGDLRCWILFEIRKDKVREELRKDLKEEPRHSYPESADTGPYNAPVAGSFQDIDDYKAMFEKASSALKQEYKKHGIIDPEHISALNTHIEIYYPDLVEQLKNLRKDLTSFWENNQGPSRFREVLRQWYLIRLEVLDKYSKYKESDLYNWIVRFYSRLVKEEFFICETEEDKRKIEREHPNCAVYLLSEITLINNFNPKELKKIHLQKKLCGGNSITKRKA